MVPGGGVTLQAPAAVPTSDLRYLRASSLTPVNGLFPTEWASAATVDYVTEAIGLLASSTANSLLGKEPTINAGSAGQYWRGDKSWQALDKSAVGLGSVENVAASATYLPLAGGTLTGTPIMSVSNGSYVTKAIPTFSDDDSVNYGGVYSRSVISNGGASGTDTYYDHVYSLGINTGTTHGVPEVAGRPYSCLHWESKFSQGGGGPYGSEFFLHYIDINGVVHRQINHFLPHDGVAGTSGSGVQYQTDTIIWSDWDGAVKAQWNINRGGSPNAAFLDSFQFLFSENNYAPFRQRNAADSAYLNLPNFDANDRLVVYPDVVVGGEVLRLYNTQIRFVNNYGLQGLKTDNTTVVDILRLGGNNEVEIGGDVGVVMRIPTGGRFAIRDNAYDWLLYMPNNSGNLSIGNTNTPSKFNVHGGVTVGAGYVAANTAAPTNGILVEGAAIFGSTLKFGTHLAIAAESITGYITITDAGGTTRKLAVVS